jgi:hypothetical protein
VGFESGTTSTITTGRPQPLLASSCLTGTPLLPTPTPLPTPLMNRKYKLLLGCTALVARRRAWKKDRASPGRHGDWRGIRCPLQPRRSLITGPAPPSLLPCQAAGRKDSQSPGLMMKTPPPRPKPPISDDEAQERCLSRRRCKSEGPGGSTPFLALISTT